MKTAVVICPGRGTYNAAELGSLGRTFPDAGLLAQFENERSLGNQESLASLDGASSFSINRHGRGDNASALIYACSLGDFLSLSGVQVVAVTGNSMGWYTALACAGALNPLNGFRVANTMGRLMQEALIGGQLVYPIVGDDWRDDPARRQGLSALVTDIATRPGHELAMSIDLGGMAVLAGNEAGLAAFETAVPREGRFPLRLANHAAFHTALQKPVAERGRAALSADLFTQPKLPMIDGRGHIWWQGATNTQALWDYTLGHQVNETYDFTRAIAHAAREFAPDLFIIPGPGNTLGGAVAQALIRANWRDMTCKADFQNRQSETPLLVSMGLPDQRATVTEGTRP
jgi:[acyl-carrier-protein] S-malonyltransferase